MQDGKFSYSSVKPSLEEVRQIWKAYGLLIYCKLG